ncbi:MAG: hypothetical protein ACRDR6_13935 [Pseudonocardiaceae bacterium]
MDASPDDPQRCTVARRRLRPAQPPGLGRLLSTTIVAESFASSAAGKVLDASAVAAWASGHLGMQTWFGIAWEPQLSFYLPAFARNEAMLLYPATEPLIETRARAPYVVLADLGPADAAAVDTRQQEAGVFDTLAS